jgi:hypothetical protein
MVGHFIKISMVEGVLILAQVSIIFSVFAFATFFLGRKFGQIMQIRRTNDKYILAVALLITFAHLLLAIFSWTHYFTSIVATKTQTGRAYFLFEYVWTSFYFLLSAFGAWRIRTADPFGRYLTAGVNLNFFFPIFMKLHAIVSGQMHYPSSSFTELLVVFATFVLTLMCFIPSSKYAAKAELSYGGFLLIAIVSMILGLARFLIGLAIVA